MKTESCPDDKISAELCCMGIRENTTFPSHSTVTILLIVYVIKIKFIVDFQPILPCTTHSL